MLRHVTAVLVLSLTSTATPGQEKPGRVDAAGDPLPPGAVARLGTVRLRHPDWVRSLAASPDGKMLASAGESRIRLWELPSGRPLKSYPHYRDPANPGLDKAPALAFSPKGELLALGNVRSGSVLYDPPTGKKLKEFDEYSADVLSADGTAAIVWSKGQQVVWDLPTASEIGKVPARVAGADHMTLSAGGKLLAASGSAAGLTRVYVGSGNALPAIPVGGVGSLAFSSDGKRLAAVVSRPAAGRPGPGDVDYQITLWDSDSGKRVCETKTIEHYIGPLAVSGDGKLIAAGLGDMTHAGGRTIVLLDSETGKELDRPIGHEAAVRAVAFAGDRVVSVCQHGTVRTWDPTSGKQVREARLPQRFTYPSLSPDGKLVAWTDTGRIRLRAITADTDSQVFGARGAPDAVISPDGKYLAAWGSTGAANEFRLWEASTGRELPDCRWRGGGRAIAFSSDSKFLARNLSDKALGYRLQIIELPTGKETRSIRVGTGLTGALAISPDGRLLAASHHDQRLQVWDLTDGATVWRQHHPARDRAPKRSVNFAGPIAFSPDGKLLASGGDDHTVRLWEVATGKEVRKFTGHEGPVLALAFSPDRKTLASASEDTTVLIWDVAAK